ncbi:hypothetical protein [Rhodococcoides yunnanense]|uniref:Uncharacterized protein n=1 Tax=Rhodococcoides yunnanense TaxID=278209 RepID=A0ABU4BDK6_9NOCA|nr:hypothetical protein [Rhodococcus yunnanensis]MDV6262279.1 hypothetical protein [Rhodococcus yunnanensis]
MAVILDGRGEVDDAEASLDDRSSEVECDEIEDIAAYSSSATNVFCSRSTSEADAFSPVAERSWSQQ